MRLKIRRIHKRWLGGSLALPLTIAVAMGCAHLNDPYKDSGEPIQAELTTPSAEGFEGRTEFGRPMRRDWEVARAEMPRGDVSHWPLWWEDPFEDKGNTDQPQDDRDAPDVKFAWVWVDYLHIAYGPARFMLNTLAWPVSAVVTPPGTLMASDGRISRGGLGYDHDARRVDSLEVDPPDVVTLPMTEAPMAEPLGPAAEVGRALEESPAMEPASGPSDGQSP